MQKRLSKPINLNEITEHRQINVFSKLYTLSTTTALYRLIIMYAVVTVTCTCSLAETGVAYSILLIFVLSYAEHFTFLITGHTFSYLHCSCIINLELTIALPSIIPFHI